MLYILSSVNWSIHHKRMQDKIQALEGNRKSIVIVHCTFQFPALVIFSSLRPLAHLDFTVNESDSQHWLSDWQKRSSSSVKHPCKTLTLTQCTPFIKYTKKWSSNWKITGKFFVWFRPDWFSTCKKFLSIQIFWWILLYNFVWTKSTPSLTFPPNHVCSKKKIRCWGTSCGRQNTPS